MTRAEKKRLREEKYQRVLKALRGCPGGMSANEVGRRTWVGGNGSAPYSRAATRMLKAMERQGLVREVPSRLHTWKWVAV